MTKTFQDLGRILDKINGKGYPAYKELQGQYQENHFTLSIDYVQGDPFASPSRIRVIVPGDKGGFPKDIYRTPYQRKAVVDFLSRTVAKNIYRFYDRVKGSGKSGLLTIGHCGQEILERNYIVINPNRVEARLEVGLPAAGRRILGNEAKEIFLDALPKIVEASLFWASISQENLYAQVKLAEDQHFLREELKKRKDRISQNHCRGSL